MTAEVGSWYQATKEGEGRGDELVRKNGKRREEREREGTTNRWDEESLGRRFLSRLLQCLQGTRRQGQTKPVSEESENADASRRKKLDSPL